MKEAAVSRFETFLQITPSCWLWKGALDGEGYGVFFYKGKRRGAHRISYEFYKEAIPPGLLIRHRCDNPKCVNPEHLETGTHKDNARDRMERGRGNYSEIRRFTKQQEARILALVRRGVGKRTLARKLEVSLATIYNVCKRASQEELLPM